MNESISLVSKNIMFGGEQSVYQHRSNACDCDMQFGIYLPPQIVNGSASSAPVLFWLSGLTCSEQNFVTKAGAQRLAAELGVIIVAPDTSPRGEQVPDDTDAAYDFGLGAGFYVDATEAPWSANYKMYSYIVDELPKLIAANFAIDSERMGIFGHSMGGHGALTIHLKNPQLFKSVSAFAPIVAPSQVPWGEKALGNYLGNDKSQWANYDACELVKASPSDALLLVEQGGADDFLENQLKPELLTEACEQSGQRLQLNMREGYDHSYYFMASFIEEHIRHHCDQLSAKN